MQTIFLSGTKCLWLPQYVNKCLVWHKIFGPAQNILGLVEGQGIIFAEILLLFRRIWWNPSKDHWIHISKWLQNWWSNRATRIKKWPLHGGICRHSHFHGRRVCTSQWPVLVQYLNPSTFLTYQNSFRNLDFRCAKFRPEKMKNTYK